MSYDGGCKLGREHAIGGHHAKRTKEDAAEKAKRLFEKGM